MILKDFSKQDLQCVLGLINKSLSCTQENHLKMLTNELRRLIPFDYAIFGLGTFDACGKISSYELVNESYPPEWIKHYISKRYHLCDPIFERNFSHYGFQRWSNTYKLKSPPRRFVLDAMDFGLYDGFSFGVRNLMGNIGGVFSIAGIDPNDQNRAKMVLNQITPHFHQALLRVTNCKANEINNSSSSLCFCLSAREKEVLNWIKHGKSTWDISTILQISERTVKFHVNNILQKLGAVNRTQAVAVALERRLIEVA